MPKKATKKGREAALRQTRSTAKFSAPADPPIIITGGGSITIESKYELKARPSTGKYPFEYYCAEVKPKKIKARGKAANFNDDCDDNGFFELKVFEM